jgi:hypothetical protein
MANRARVITTTNVDIQVWKADRRCTTGKRLVAYQRKRNLTVDAGLNFIRDLLNSGAANGITHFGYGTSATAAASSQTALVAQVARDTVTVKTATSKTLTVTYYLATGSGNGNTLREIGLFNAASSGTMYARAVLAAAIVKTSSISVTFTWTLTWAAA